MSGTVRCYIPIESKCGVCGHWGSVLADKAFSIYLCVDEEVCNLRARLKKLETEAERS